jgi:hypothetical protein
MEVNVCVSKRATGNSITTYSDGCHGTDTIEHLKEQAFGDIDMKITNIEGCTLE